jgi:uracil phosphoribosyltransferase
MGTVYELSKHQSYFNQFLAEMRDRRIQQDRMRFRANMRRAAAVVAYEMSRHFPYQEQEVHTTLGSTTMPLLQQQPVIASILRAGLPFHQGFLDFFDRADNAFISAYRAHTDDTRFVIKLEYLAAPDLTDRLLVLLDPMIATGRSMITAWEALQDQSRPSAVYVGGIIASEEGIEYVRSHLPDAPIFVGAIDSELTAKAYIVPGLGDAGDLAFGLKE